MVEAAQKPRINIPVLVKQAERAQQLEAAMCAMLWTLRHKNEDFTILVPPAQEQSFSASMKYNEQQPRIHLDETKHGLVIRMACEDGTGIVQSESTEEDQDKKEKYIKMRQIRDSVPGLVAEHKNLEDAMEDSSSLNNELRYAALFLAQQLR